MRNGETFKDWLINRYLLVTNYIKHNIFRIRKGKYEIPDNYSIKYQDHFNHYDENHWELNQYFGRIHPNIPWRYASEDCCKFTDDGLILENKFNNRTIENYWDGKKYHTEVDFGIMTSKEPYRYGIYEWEVVLPKEHEQWSSLWLTGYDSWPPEIDIVETYSNNGKYKSNLKTNIHYGDNQDIMIRGLKSLYFNEKNIYNVQNYKLVWEEDLIEIYLNDYKVRVVTDKGKLKYFNNQRMYVVMNNTMSYDYKKADKDQVGKLNIKFFKYYKKDC